MVVLIKSGRLGGRPGLYLLDVLATLGIRDLFAASYTVIYDAAEAFQEKSFSIALTCIARQVSRSRWV
jgi:hypothetical protein